MYHVGGSWIYSLTNQTGFYITSCTTPLQHLYKRTSRSLYASTCMLLQVQHLIPLKTKDVTVLRKPGDSFTTLFLHLHAFHKNRSPCHQHSLWWMALNSPRAHYEIHKVHLFIQFSHLNLCCELLSWVSYAAVIWPIDYQYHYQSSVESRSSDTPVRKKQVWQIIPHLESTH